MHVNPDRAKDWDEVARTRYGFEVERMDAFEFHLPGRTLSRAEKACLFVPSLLRFFMDGWRQWRALCKKYQPSIVLCGGTYSAGWLMPGNPASSLLVNYVHGEELTMQVKPLFLLPFMRALQRRSLQRAAMNIAVSRYTADLIAPMSDRVTLLPNFIDHERFRVSGMREELRRKFGCHGKTVLLTVARLEKRKGIDQALRALALLNERGMIGEDWHYLIGGRGPELEPLRRLAEELRITRLTKFLGFIPDADLPALYEAADVFLQPNRDIDGDTEGFGVVFLEAAACGLPVIGGIAGGTADAIDDGRNGLRVDGESVSQIADAIALLMGNREKRLAFSEHSIQWAARFDVEKAAAAFEQILTETQVPQTSAAPAIVQ
jgi:phosphatidylinositol alpha-1,6-mannosyltransferase